MIVHPLCMHLFQHGISPSTKCRRLSPAQMHCELWWYGDNWKALIRYSTPKNWKTKHQMTAHPNQPFENMFVEMETCERSCQQWCCGSRALWTSGAGWWSCHQSRGTLVINQFGSLYVWDGWLSPFDNARISKAPGPAIPPLPGKVV